MQTEGWQSEAIEVQTEGQQSEEVGVQTNDLENPLLCVVCMNDERELIFILCGHVIVCRACFRGMRGNQICPLCHAIVVNTKRVHF